jgi:hypothetical protein
MLEHNRFAFKEWAAVCAALAAGRQSAILRKGGLHEGRAGFRVEHREFWLFPTAFHQQPDALVAEAADLWERGRSYLCEPGTIALEDYAVVEAVHEIRDEALLPRLTGLHVWSERTVHDRYRYRTPGLFALVVRMYRRVPRWTMADSPHFAGCRSWVDLPVELSTAGLQPVLSDADHARAAERIAEALAPRAWV